MFSLSEAIIEALLGERQMKHSVTFIGILCLIYTPLIGIINNTRKTDIELTSCRQTLNPYIV